MIIGLTGGIATGKSTVAKFFEELGAVRIDTDILAREVVKPGQPAWQAIVREFGQEILDSERRIDRKALAALVFNDSIKLQLLNKITHPAVRTLLRRQVADALRQGAKVILIEVPLLFEAGFEKEVDKTIVVFVNEEIQLARLMQRDGFSGDEATKRIGTQMPLREKVQRADLIINNSGTPEETRKQVVELWQTLKQECQHEI
ncbi:MAG: dephospho-CoA kinase [Clostridiales bacterium]|jgi:dephospho-CoA kinase|nr:dephospho-CoA kinase [Clostridiales bacterium]